MATQSRAKTICRRLWKHVSVGRCTDEFVCIFRHVDQRPHVKQLNLISGNLVFREPVLSVLELAHHPDSPFVSEIAFDPFPNAEPQRFAMHLPMGLFLVVAHRTIVPIRRDFDQASRTFRDDSRDTVVLKLLAPMLSRLRLGILQCGLQVPKTDASLGAPLLAVAARFMCQRLLSCLGGGEGLTGGLGVLSARGSAQR